MVKRCSTLLEQKLWLLWRMIVSCGIIYMFIANMYKVNFNSVIAKQNLEDRAILTLKKHNMTSALSRQSIQAEDTRKHTDSYVLKNTYIDLNFTVLSIPKLPFLENYRNPCWYEKKQHTDVRRTLRCLPYFYLAGVEKCGTTDLYYSLLKHDRIVGPEMKEPHYWGKGRYQPKGNFTNYLNCFSRAARTFDTQTTISDSGETFHPSIAMDASADTFLNNFMWRKFSDYLIDPEKAKQILSPYQIKHLTPNAKFVVSLRNPADRLYSSYNYFPMYSKRKKAYNESLVKVREKLFASKCPEDFHNKVLKAMNWFSNCTKTFTNSLKCFFWNEGMEELDNFVTHMQMGLYGLQLLEWVKAFPIENFKFVTLEKLGVNNVAVLNEILEFLELSPVSEPMKWKLDFMPRVKNSNPVLPMLPQTRQILLNFYNPFNKILADLLRDSKFLYER